MATAPKPKPKKVLPKRPTGELPKRSSELAKYIGGKNQQGQVIPKELKLDLPSARAAAGKYRENVKKNPAGVADRSWMPLKKAIGQVRAAQKAAAAKPKPKVTSKPKPKGPYEKDYMKPPKTEKKKKK
jgi:hypothetical protein